MPKRKGFVPMNQLSPEEQYAIRAAGGRAAAQARAYNKSFKRACEEVLAMPAFQGNTTVNKVREKFPNLTNVDAMAISAVARMVQSGDPKAFAVIRDTVGEMPVQNVNLNKDKAMKIEVSILDDDAPAPSDDTDDEDLDEE